MNISAMSLEIAVIALGLITLLLDLWIPVQHRPKLGYFVALALAGILGWSFTINVAEPVYSFREMFVLDSLALFFKRFFILATLFVVIIGTQFAEKFQSTISEYYSIILLSLAGMLFASSSNDLIMVFVSMELITISFYILVSFQRGKVASLEAGLKYLILGALSTGFLVFGIALVFGSANSTLFGDLLLVSSPLLYEPIYLLGLLMVLAGIGFKIAAFPFQMWAPDVYQGAPVPTTAFLAVGSKAAGIVLLMRFLFSGVPVVAEHWNQLLIVISAITILYGNLCAIPQRNIKRLFGYSSIANAGYLLLGFAALNKEGTGAILYFLAGYLFTVLCAFTVLAIVAKDNEDITSLGGLSQRSPLMASALTLAMVSLAGIPPLAGFFGKFLLIKAVLVRAETNPAFYWLIGIAILGVLISIYYYFGVIRAIYWTKEPADLSPVRVPLLARIAIYACIIGMLFLGLYPDPGIELANNAIAVFKF